MVYTYGRSQIVYLEIFFKYLGIVSTDNIDDVHNNKEKIWKEM